MRELRSVIVSGGGTGIGRATARRFARAGDQVTLIGRRQNVLTAAAAEINAEAGAARVEALAADLSQPADVERAAAIVNVSSIAAVNGGGDSYSGAKAAILGWTVDLALRLGPDVRVNAVVPGYIEGTEFFGDRMTEERHERLVARTVLGRAGLPDDVAGCVFFLASDDAAYVTGQFLHVNGGALLGR